MIFIILSIFFSVSVATLLKLAKRYQINVIQAICTNYLTAIVLSLFFFKPQLSAVQAGAPWWLYLSLGLLLPTIFLFFAASVKNLGIVKTDIAQRLSLFISILAAFFIFKENLSSYKIIGLIIGFTAILLTFYRPNTTKNIDKVKWHYPLMVFIGFGLIDVLFKQLALYAAVPYKTSLTLVFCLSFVVSLAIVSYYRWIKQVKIQLNNLLCGIVLGVFNFGNILFYLKAHQSLAKNPAVVFAAMNLGVIILAGLIGIIVFKEKLSQLNYIGLAMALVAIIFITLSYYVV